MAERGSEERWEKTVMSWRSPSEEEDSPTCLLLDPRFNPGKQDYMRFFFAYAAGAIEKNVSFRMTNLGTEGAN